MHNNLIKHLTVVVIIFSNLSFGKEFNELFTIYEPIENNSKIEQSINLSFNNMVYRLSGDDSPSNIWKIINSGTSRKDLIMSYSIKNIDSLSYLQVKFNQDMLVSKFKELSIPIIGYSRPVVLFLFEVDSGSDQPYFISANKEIHDMDDVIREILNSLSRERGIFLELPIFDLEDTKHISSFNVLADPKSYIALQYDYHKLVNIKISNLGLNDWLISGDMNTAFESSNFVEDFEDKLRTFLSILIDESLDEFQIQISNESFAYISIQGINNLEDYFELNKKMKMILSIPSLEIISFSDNTIFYKASTYGSIDSILKEIESNGFLDILASEEGSNSINLYYKK
ncbi:DUF2066 domain-containing protein [Gammaproteobacteria bacterium]|nr:DUF2066 domain-containing protein [Gammaproteobacteria bacterium]MDA8955452.1 DUF2066 domain-containing protein [Gammaproteobacteria bacterium]MDA9102278.1 DUF2066 domain-containing protein [Gammaproteobacteria bacterium]